MLVFNHKGDFFMYVPVMKTKKGEITALSKLPESVLNSIMPLFLNIHNDVAKNFLENKKLKCFLMTDEDGGIPLKYDGVIPVFFINQPENISVDNYEELALRIPLKDFSDPEEQLDLLSLLGQSLKNSSKKFHLLLDFEDLDSNSEKLYKLYSNTILEKLKDFSNIESIVTIGTSSSLASEKLEKGKPNYITRHHKRLYEYLKKSYPFISYGDYTIFSSFADSEENLPFRGAEKIRYTIKDDFFCLKGSRSEKGISGYPKMSNIIINHPEFKGDNFSDGDRFIFDCATKTDVKNGNLTTWVTNDIIHHITFVVEELS